MARSSAFHEALPYGLTDFTEVAGALGENQPIRHLFFAGQAITSATVNLSGGMERRWESGNDRLHCLFDTFCACFGVSRIIQGDPRT
jgi:hypothetical protein